MRHDATRVSTMLRVLVVASTAAVGAQSAPPAIVGGAVVYPVARGDTWQSVGARFGVDAALVAADNDANPRSLLATGTRLAIDTRHIVPANPESGIVINLPQRMLFFKDQGVVAASYPVGLGRPDWPTFIGPFTVVRTEIDPVWDVPRSIQEELRRAGKRVVTRVPAGPANPLGKYYLALSEANFGIHGTNAPRSIYRFESHGCIRLHPDDVADLFPRVSAGTAGAIVYEPILLTIDGSGAVLLEAHRDIYRREERAPNEVVRDRAAAFGVTDRVDWRAVETVLKARDGRPRDITGR
jgi:L,D-transpeptidase ErfK/SrfK